MKVVLSTKACNQLEALLKYLELKWSAQTRRKFQKRLDLFIKAIKAMPNSFPESTIFPNCRKCVVTPQTSIFYTVSDDVITILSISDNRQMTE